MSKIGIFAGTFDPIHDGHIAFARAALDQGLDKVMFLTEPRPRRKQGVRALEHRLAMVRLAVDSEPRFGVVVLEQARFTAHETLPKLQARFPGHRLVLLFGGDVISHIAHWPHVDSLVQAVDLLIATRRENEAILRSTLSTLNKTAGLKFTYDIIHPKSGERTSSTIRHSLKHDNPAIGLQREVQAYIAKHRLYCSAET